MLNRLRLALVILWGVACASFAIAAQPPGKVPRIGVINEQGPKAPTMEAFRQGLRELGYIEGQNISVEYRHVQGILDRIPEVVSELLRLNIDVMVVGGTVAAQTAKAQSTKVPIVFAIVADPVGSGLVATLGRPGGNVTGLTNLLTELGAKQMELLKDLVPRAGRVAVLHGSDPGSKVPLTRTEDAARALSIELRLFAMRQPSELADAFAASVAWRAGAVLALSNPVIGNELVQLATLGAVHRMPIIYLRREFAEVGGLLTYGPSFSENYRRAATYVHKILKGAKPAELPVEQPTKFDLVVNLKTAKAIGLEIPPSILVRATEVIR